MEELLITEIKKLISLTDKEADLIQKSFYVKKISKKEYLIQAGHKCEFECFIKQGLFRSYYVNDKDEELITHFSKEGDWLSDYRSLLTNKKATLNIQALEDSEILIINKKELDTLNEKIPQWDKAGRVFFENEFQKKEALLEKRISKSAEERYLDILENEVYLLNRISLSMISKYIGIKPESLSRIRKKISF